MPNLLSSPEGLPPKLKSYIAKYNALLNDEEPTKENELRKLFYLQQINNHIFELPAQTEIAKWKNEVGKNSLEEHLQKYGIYRDSSILLQSIKLAIAVREVLDLDPLDRTQSSGLPLYAAMRTRNQALQQEEPTNENLNTFAENNLAILQQYNSDIDLQAKIKRHERILSLTYAKIDAIQGFVEQNFAEYQSKPLGDQTGNNKNYTLSVEGESERVVIRVEDREQMGAESTLQTHEVSSYFSEDYAAFMMPVTVNGANTIRPIVISEMAKEAGLDAYSRKLQSVTSAHPEIAVQNAQHFFTQLNDFCTKLMDAGYYHPDIKLSNFLTDGEKIIISDRKTLIKKKEPTAAEILSTPRFAAPEYMSCFDGQMVMNGLVAKSTKLNMPSYMSYQMGMALKEFMYNSLGVGVIDLEPLVSKVKNPSKEILNISLLIQELTRDNPKDRLAIKDFQTLMEKIDLSPKEFQEEVEKALPIDKLSTQNSILAIREFATVDIISPELLEKIENIPENHFEDPRILAVLASQPNVNNYLKQVESALRARDVSLVPSWRQYLRVSSIPKVSTVADLDSQSMPQMDPKTQVLINIYAKYSHPGVDNDVLLKQVCARVATQPTPVVENSNTAILASLSKGKKSSNDTAPSADSLHEVQLESVSNSPQQRKANPQQADLADDDDEVELESVSGGPQQRKPIPQEADSVDDDEVELESVSGGPQQRKPIPQEADSVDDDEVELGSVSGGPQQKKPTPQQANSVDDDDVELGSVSGGPQQKKPTPQQANSVDDDEVELGSVSGGPQQGKAKPQAIVVEAPKPLYMKYAQPTVQRKMDDVPTTIARGDNPTSALKEKNKHLKAQTEAAPAKEPVQNNEDEASNQI
jgi:serine/threonine protein kinase